MPQMQSFAKNIQPRRNRTRKIPYFRQWKRPEQKTRQTTRSVRGWAHPRQGPAIIEKLVRTGFAKRKGKQILPTKDGTLLVSVLPDTLISADMTAEWENALTLILKGKENPKTFMQGIETMIAEFVNQYKGFDRQQENPFEKEAGRNGRQ